MTADDARASVSAEDALEIIREHAAAPGTFVAVTRGIVVRLGRGMTVDELEEFRRLRETPERPVSFRVRDVLLEVLACWKPNGTFVISTAVVWTDAGVKLELQAIAAVLLALGWQPRKIEGRRRLFRPGTGEGRCPQPPWNQDFAIWEEALQKFGAASHSDNVLAADCPVCGTEAGLLVADRRDRGMGIRPDCSQCTADLEKAERLHWRRKLRGLVFAPL